MDGQSLAKGTRQIASGATVDHHSECPICGKVFTWYTCHAYTIAKKSGPDMRFCSWSCYRKARAQQAEKRLESVERIRKKNKDIWTKKKSEEKKTKK